MISEKVLHPELSYKIVGLAFTVFNNVGFGMSEKFYQKALATEFNKENLSYEKEKFIKVKYRGDVAGKYLLDFVVNNQIVVELKVRPRLGYVHIRQVKEYLCAVNCKLALLIYFTKEGVKYRRIIN